MKSWEDYEKHFAVQSANEKGDLFEQFCKALIATHKSFMAKEVYLGHEIPTKEVNDTKLTQLDRGHDGLFIQTDGTRVVFQAKYRKNANLTHTELSTFFNVSEFADQRMIFRTTGLSKEAQEVIEKKNNVRNIDIDFFKSLTQEDFIKINDFMEKGRFSHQKPRPLWPIQEKALQDLINLPHSNKLHAPERATCVMPCGTGKTLLSIRYAEKIKAKRIVVLLPSLMLIEQAMKDWCTDSLIPTEDFSYHVICSDQKKSRCTKNDDIYISKSDLPFLRSTDKEEVSS